MTLAHAAIAQTVIIKYVGGDRAFRRRLMELGLVPGTRAEIIGVAPLGDPLEILVRGCSLSIRRGEALCVAVERQAETTATATAETALRACGGGCGSLGCGAQVGA
jgi:ferrous iron transport protein A